MNAVIRPRVAAVLAACSCAVAAQQPMPPAPQGAPVAGVQGAPAAQRGAVPVPSAAPFGTPAAAVGQPLPAAPAARAAVQVGAAYPGGVIPVPSAAGGGGAPMPMPMPAAAVPVDVVNELLDRTSPLTPAEIRRLRGAILERERAWNENVTGAPPPKSRVVEYRLDLSPGVTPPVVRVTLGQGALVSFVSADGKPWPLQSAENFNGGGLGVMQLAPHVLSVSLRVPSATGSVGVMLEGLTSPITFTVVPAQAETDHRVDVIVPRLLGGGAPAQAQALALPSFDTADLTAFLLRIPPQTARTLEAVGPHAQVVLAWQTGTHRMVVRTPLAVVSPAILRRHSSADGMHVYELPLSPAILVVNTGATSVGGYETVAFKGIQYLPTTTSAAAGGQRP